MSGGTFLYSPGVRVLIDTERYGILDVSEDLKQGNLALAENQSSKFNFSIINHRRKYDGAFAPNDRIHVQMKRINWIPVFSGYLDEVPMFSVYPRTISLRASCTLKRLKMRYWDIGAQASVTLLNSASLSQGNNQFEQQDGGLRDKVIALLTEVGEWPLHSIHIGRIPEGWSTKMEPLFESLSQELALESTGALGTGGSISGSSVSSIGTRVVTGIGAGTGTLPQTKGRVQTMSGSRVEFELTGEVNPRDDWHISMRWPYRSNFLPKSAQDSLYLSAEETSAAKRWWRNRKIIVSNPANNRGVVLRAADWGPDPDTDRELTVTSHVMKTVLKAEDGDTLDIRFAPEEMELGPVPEASIPVGAAQPTQYGTTPEFIESSSGARFASRDNLRSHVAAARDFIRQSWSQTTTIGGYADRNISGTNTPSDHAKGLALDVTISDAIGTEPTSAQIAFGNSVAAWFVANPQAFGTRYVIWNDKANYGNGWVPYREKDQTNGRNPSVTQGHRDHVHISFEATSLTQIGPMGSPFPGAFDPFLVPQVQGSPTAQSGSGFGPFNGSGPLLGAAANWFPQSDLSDLLTGPRALLNDSPLYETVHKLTSASMRSHMSAPNGDFIGWFPDYFGQYGTAGVMTIRDIELAGDGFTMAWSDENLVTHQFTAGVFPGYQPGAQPGGDVTLDNRLLTHGIATVEFPELMKALFNVSSTGSQTEIAKYFRDADAILQRFGARPNYKPLSLIMSHEAEFWFAVWHFMRSWASQFSSKPELTFMPELYPGMLANFEGIKLQAYVTAVNHSFDFGGGGFSTTATIIAPSATDRSGLYGLPLAGKVPPMTRNPRRGRFI